MSQTWPHTTHAKIHENCGGYVRWVEAYDQPGVGYTGECLRCGHDRVVLENIIPIESGADETGYQLYQSAENDVLDDLTWHDDATFDENQERLREVINP